MTVEVGDKVIVFNAGSDYSYAKKILPVEVGDKVDVFTLSDGTKIPLPRISLNVSDYVFLVPSIPKLEMPPLSVVINTVGWGTITNHWENPPADAVDKNWVEDTTQVRTPGSLVGKYMCMVTGKNAKKYYAISANTATRIAFGAEINAGLKFGGSWIEQIKTHSVFLNTGEFDVWSGNGIRLPYTVWKEYIAENSTLTLQVQINRYDDTNPFINWVYLYFDNLRSSPPYGNKQSVPDGPGSYIFQWTLLAKPGRDLICMVWSSNYFGDHRYQGLAQGVRIKQVSYPNFTTGDRYLILAALPT